MNRKCDRCKYSYICQDNRSEYVGSCPKLFDIDELYGNSGYMEVNVFGIGYEESEIIEYYIDNDGSLIRKE